MEISSTVEPSVPVWLRSPAEERANTITHGLGFVLAVVGALVMTAAVFDHGDTWRMVGCSVYLLSLMGVYLMSTLSHAVPNEWKPLFRRLDQAFIYLLIVATYTPFSVAYLRSFWWWALLAAMWTIAIVGFVAKLFFAHRVDVISVVSYIVLGWMPIMAAPALANTLPFGAFAWMLVGGACYTIGTLFLRYDERIRHFHAVWHLCVIAGSVCHFLGILLFVVGGAS